MSILSWPLMHGHCFPGLSWYFLGCHLQIADFGMSRDLMDETYYMSHGGQIPVKWTAPEV